MKWLLLLSVVVVLASVVRGKSLQEEWDDFKLKYNKVYHSEEEELFRRRIFAENLDYIAQHNLRYEHGQETYTVGINHLSDRTYEEVTRLLGFRPHKHVYG